MKATTFLTAAALALAAGACGSQSAAPAPPKHDGGAPDPAAGDVPASAPCTVVPQGGCPPDHTCAVAGASGETSCYGAGPVPTGAACANPFDCVPGDICVYGACAPLCAQNGDCKCDGAQCWDAENASGQPVPGYTTCTIQCNPADPQNQAGAKGFGACGAGLRCDPNALLSGTTFCDAAGGGGPGASCQSSADCVPGYVCLDDTTTMTASCTQMCLMGSGDTCGAGACQSFGQPEYVGSTEIGYCG